MSSSAPLLVVYIVIFVGVCVTAISYMLFPKEQSSTAPASEIVSLTPDENTVPFSYNVPVDSHMDYKNDVVIVVEHPDDKIAVGVR
jgi:hypothetical protein